MRISTYNLAVLIAVAMLVSAGAYAQGPMSVGSDNAAALAASQAKAAELQGQLASSKEELRQASIHRDVPRARRASGSISRLQGQINALDGRVANIERSGLNGLSSQGQVASSGMLQDFGYRTQGQLDQRYVLQTTGQAQQPAPAPASPPAAINPAPAPAPAVPQAPAAVDPAAPVAPVAPTATLAPLAPIAPLAPATQPQLAPAITPAATTPASAPLTGAQIRGEVWTWAWMIIVVAIVVGLFIWIVWPAALRGLRTFGQTLVNAMPAGTTFKASGWQGNFKFEVKGRS